MIREGSSDVPFSSTYGIWSTKAAGYEVSRAKPFENDPREARGEVLFASEPNNIMPRGGEPFDEACTH